MIDRELQIKIELATIDKFQRLPRNAMPHRNCMLWAFAAAEALNVYGFASCINAGSAWFKMNDNPVGADHWSYEWQEGRTLQELLALRHLPEVHSWAVVPDLGLILDCTTGYLPRLVTEAGFTWQRPTPPDMLWCDAAQPVEGFRYKSEEQACELVYTLLEHLLKGAACSR